MQRWVSMWVGLAVLVGVICGATAQDWAALPDTGSGVQASWTQGDFNVPYVLLNRTGDEAPAGERRLFICLHGGGQNASADGPHSWGVNTREHQAQVSLASRVYAPGGVYVIPRMGDDRIGRWWHADHIDFIEGAMDQAVQAWGVHPDRVYLLGVSEGAYGTAVLAPWFADRLAGALVMAGGVSVGNPPANLRNVAYRTDVGEGDTAFDRVSMARAYHEALDALRVADPDGYTHAINVQAGRGHGIDYAPGIQWLVQHERDADPDRVVWVRTPVAGRLRDRSYWLAVEDHTPDAGVVRLVAERDPATRTITLDAHRLATHPGGYPTHVGEVDASTPEPLSGVTLTVDLPEWARGGGSVVLNGQPMPIEPGGRTWTYRLTADVSADAAAVTP